MIKKILFLLIIIFNIASLSGQQLYPVIDEEEKVGYIDIDGRVAIEPQFDTKIKYINYIDGKKKYKAVVFQQNTYFSEGVATVKIANRFWIWFIISYDFALIDTKGNFITEPESSGISNFNEGLATKKIRVAYDSTGDYEYDYVGKDGGTQISKGFVYAGPFSGGLALVRLRGGTYGYIDKTDRFVIVPEFEDASNFSEGLASVKIGDKWGYINKAKEIIINPAFDRAFEFNNGVARVVIKSKIRYINKSGNFINIQSYYYGSEFSEGLASVKANGRYGFIDTTGNMVIQPTYLAAENFSEGLACVKIRGKWGFINKEENRVIKPKYDFARGFDNGLATVWKDDVVYYINRGGDVIWPLLDYRK